MSARYALAWKVRENNPELVQDEADPRARQDQEKADAEREAVLARPPGQPPSVKGVVEQAGRHRKWGRNEEDEDEDGVNFFPSSPSRSTNPPLSQRLPGYPSRAAQLQKQSWAPWDFDESPGNVPYLALYKEYTHQRDRLEDEGFWGDQNTLMAEDYFGFSKYDEELKKESEEPREETPAASDLGRQSALRRTDDEDGANRKKSGKRVVISSNPPLSTTIPADSEDTGIDTMPNSRDGSQSEITMDGRWRKHDPMEYEEEEDEFKKTSVTSRDNEGVSRDGASVSDTGTPSNPLGRGAPTTTDGQPDLMSRFYARLQELHQAKLDDEESTNNTDVFTRSRDRKRIKTALRRLLTERLFPDEAKSKKRRNKGTPTYDLREDGLESGTITPLTLGSRSKTATSMRSRFDGSTRANTRMENQGKVLFVGERSRGTTRVGDGEQSTTQPEGQGEAGPGEGERQEEEEEEVPYYKRHPLGNLKHGKVSRLYQPPMSLGQRSRSNLTQSSLQHGLRRDKDFLQRVKGADSGLRPDTRWSVPEYSDRSRQNRHQIHPAQGGSVWRREKTEISWTYNLGRQHQQQQQQQQDQGAHTSRSVTLRGGLDDWRLRKLLEELYQDKKYMDRIIDTSAPDDQEEAEVCHKLSDGREYLLERALYWLEKGPLPPRPPTTDLGYRMQKQRAQTCPQTGGQTPLPPPKTPASRGTNLSAASTASSESFGGKEENPPATPAGNRKQSQGHDQSAPSVQNGGGWKQESAQTRKESVTTDSANKENNNGGDSNTSDHPVKSDNAGSSQKPSNNESVPENKGGVESLEQSTTPTVYTHAASREL